MPLPLQVLITGATGRTGSLVFEKLRNMSATFNPRGFARSPQKAEERVRHHRRLLLWRHPEPPRT